MDENRAFDRIIGYEDVKAELKELADVLRDTAKYERLGVRPPRGLLIHGVPGIGKTLMAGCLIEASGRKVFTCRKQEGKESFTRTIQKTFGDAAKEAPSVVLLDDLDKYANDDQWHVNSEEFVTVQSVIDETKDRDVFVIATANSLELLPESLIRKGRFDRSIELTRPDPVSAVRIVEHYLEGKPVEAGMDCELIAKILGGESCATLEAVVNEAGISAGLRNRERIGMDDMVRALVRVLYDAPAALSPVQKEQLIRTAVHEAGHAVASELLNPGSVCLVSVCHGSGSIGGITAAGPETGCMGVKETEDQIRILLAGRAATELVFGEPDPGALGDMKRASLLIWEQAKPLGTFGAEMRFLTGSEQYAYRKEEYISRELERYDREVKRLLARNRSMLEKLSARLVEKQTLVGKEIAASWEGDPEAGAKM